MTITGIDVSSYQSETYSLTGVDFVFVKATEGTGYTNPKHAAQVKRARAGGRVVGHYHYLTAGASMSAQMDHFLAKAAPRAGELLAVDWEETGVSGAQKDAAIRYLKSKAGGRKVLLYCSQNFWTTRDTTSYAGDGLWIAQYNGQPGRPDIKAPWVIHQHTDTPLDTNVAQFASRTAMAAWAAGTTDQEDTVAITDDDAKKVARAVLTADGIIPNPYAVTAKNNPYISAATSLRNIEIVARRSEAKLDAQSAAITRLASLAGTGVDTATVVAEVRQAIADAVVHVDVDVTGAEG